MKTCIKCKIEKPAIAFYRASTKIGLSGRCKKCIRKQQKHFHLKNPLRRAVKWRRWAYGLAEADFVALLAKQNNRCALCEQGLGEGRKTHIDHCHITGVVRGLLCNSCNTALGRFKDSPALLRKAAEYIENAKI